MNDKCITAREFEIYRSAQQDVHRSIGKNVEQNQKDTKEIKEMLFELTSVIKEEVALVRRIQSEHEIQYNNDKEAYNSRFTDLAQRQDKIIETLAERDGVYKAAKNVKWALSLVFIGLIAAFSKDLYFALSSKEPPVKHPTHISEEKKNR